MIWLRFSCLFLANLFLVFLFHLLAFLVHKDFWELLKEFFSMFVIIMLFYMWFRWINVSL